ncbi:phosphatase PAP2 family protein [Ferrimonas gelatinilytica]|uniref:undecaprenyl-diphosphate phosphatase n=1 Tax=Ferrimonas gelatinilytica TaxID=1255257 RepID=A0ABP9S1S7_9GAMM
MKPLPLVLGSTLSLLLPGVHASTSEDLAHALRLALPATAVGVSLYEKDKEGLKQFGLSFVASSATTLALKQAVDSERPDGSDNDSFPSGHATNAFSAAGYLQRRYGWDYGLPAYALASWTAVSRVNTDQHHWADVLAGAAIALAFNHYLVSPGPRLQLVPTVTSEGFYLNGALHF